MTVVEMTRESVLAAMEAPIEQNAQGGYVCRMGCGKAFPSPRAVPVHELGHRRAVGLAPPAHKGREKLPEWITCGIDGCTERVKRTSLSMHLQGPHKMSRTDAVFAVRERTDEERSGPKKGGRLARLMEEPSILEPEPSVFTDIAPEELVAGILSASITDGLMPVRMLPSVLGLVSHTGAVLKELRARRK